MDRTITNETERFRIRFDDLIRDESERYPSSRYVHYNLQHQQFWIAKDDQDQLVLVNFTSRASKKLIHHAQCPAYWKSVSSGSAWNSEKFLASDVKGREDCVMAQGCCGQLFEQDGKDEAWMLQGPQSKIMRAGATVLNQDCKRCEVRIGLDTLSSINLVSPLFARNVSVAHAIPVRNCGGMTSFGRSCSIEICKPNGTCH